MSDPVYDWFKDFFMPGAAAIGSTLFGLGAVLAARKANNAADESNGLAASVRNDELKREADAAKERYKDQLFRTIEPTITAMLEHRAELQRYVKLGTADELSLRSAALARLRLVFSVVSTDDGQFVGAAVRAYNDAIKTGRAHVVGLVLGQLVLNLAELLEEGRDIDKLVNDTTGLTPAMVLVADAASRSTPT